MVRIFLENKELDINEGFTHQMTYAVDDLKNLDSKSTAYSKTIVLPGTTKNNSLLGNIFEIHNSNFTVNGATNIGYNFNATVSAKVRVEVNGIQIVKGILRLMEIIIDGSHIEYEVVIFGELGGFYSKLGGRKLEDIDFSDYTHTYDYTSISNSWLTPITFTGTMDFVTNKLIIFGIKDYTLKAGDQIIITNAGANNGTHTVSSYSYYGSKATITKATNWASQANYLAGTITFEAKGYGYYYPLIDYGMVSIDKYDYDVKALRPSVFVKEIMHRMIVDAGYTWESNFFNSELFENLILPNNQKNFEVLKTRIFTGLTQSFSFDGSVDNVSLTNTANIISTTTPDNITYTYTGANGFFVVNYAVTFNTIKIKNSAFNFSLGFKIALFKDRSGTVSAEYLSPAYTYYQYTSVYDGAGNYVASVDIGFNFTITLPTMDLHTSDKFFFVLYQSTPTSLSGSSTTANTTITIDSAVPIMLPVAIGDSVKVNSCIPQNILQKDFFTSIMKMFNLMIIEDKLVEKKLIIEPYVDFYQTSPSTYIDWTYKIDRNSPIRIKPMSEANARVYKMNYKEDSDFYNENYKKKFSEGYSSFTYDNLLEFSKETSSLEILFASTPIVSYGNAINTIDKTVSTIFKKTNEAEDSTSSVPRILYRQNKEMYAYKLYNNIWDSGTSSVYVSGVTNFPYAGHLLIEGGSPLFDFSFGAPKEIYAQFSFYTSENLFNTYYSPYIAEITDKDSRLVTMKAKLTEIDIYNLDFRKLIFVDGVLYRLQKVIDYSAGELCTIELLRVINVIY